MKGKKKKKEIYSRFNFFLGFSSVAPVDSSSSDGFGCSTSDFEPSWAVVVVDVVDAVEGNWSCMYNDTCLSLIVVVFLSSEIIFSTALFELNSRYAVWLSKSMRLISPYFSKFSFKISWVTDWSMSPTIKVAFSDVVVLVVSVFSVVCCWVWSCCWYGCWVGCCPGWFG